MTQEALGSRIVRKKNSDGTLSQEEWIEFDRSVDEGGESMSKITFQLMVEETVPSGTLWDTGKRAPNV